MAKLLLRKNEVKKAMEFKYLHLESIFQVRLAAKSMGTYANRVVKQYQCKKV
jgi:hypothetical protein